MLGPSVKRYSTQTPVSWRDRRNFPSATDVVCPRQVQHGQAMAVGDAQGLSGSP
jgi:hypothetical protein